MSSRKHFDDEEEYFSYHSKNKKTRYQKKDKRNMGLGEQWASIVDTDENSIFPSKQEEEETISYSRFEANKQRKAVASGQTFVPSKPTKPIYHATPNTSYTVIIPEHILKINGQEVSMENMRGIYKNEDATILTLKYKDGTEKNFNIDSPDFCNRMFFKGLKYIKNHRNAGK